MWYVAIKDRDMFKNSNWRLCVVHSALAVWMTLYASSCRISAQAPASTSELMELQSDISYGSYAALAPDRIAKMTQAEQEVLKVATFDLAAIHPVKENDIMQFSSSYAFDAKGNFKANGVSLQFLISMAWGIGNTFIQGGPEWIATKRYTLDARSGDDLASRIAATSVPAQRMIRQKMLQALLADRFQLKTHIERRDRPVLFLELAKSGSRLKVSPDEKPDSPAGPVRSNSNASELSRVRILEGHSQTAGQLATQLSHVVQRVVVDRTGLKGKYDFHIEWSDDSSRANADAFGETGAGGDRPSLLTALEEQLGLRLSGGKASIEVLVIDSAQAPSDN